MSYPKPIEREFFIDNLLVLNHFVVMMVGWTGLAPWDFEFPFPGSLTSTFLSETDTILAPFRDPVPCLFYPKAVQGSGFRNEVSTVSDSGMTCLPEPSLFYPKSKEG